MFKRKNWVQDHGADGGDSSSSEESDSGDEGTPSSSEQGGTGAPDEPAAPGASDEDSSEAGDRYSGSGGENADSADSGGADGYAMPLTRLEDLSEDDFEDPADDPELIELKSNWLEAPKEAQAPGRPLRCRACRDVLILSAASLRSHVASRRHRRATAELPPDSPDPVCFAEDVAAESGGEEGETHAERLQRLDAEVAALRSAAASDKVAGSKRQREEQRKPRQRPGKRQRQALRAQWAADPASAPKLARRRRSAPASAPQPAAPSATGAQRPARAGGGGAAAAGEVEADPRPAGTEGGKQGRGASSGVKGAHGRPGQRAAGSELGGGDMRGAVHVRGKARERGVGGGGARLSRGEAGRKRSRAACEQRETAAKGAAGGAGEAAGRRGRGRGLRAALARGSRGAAGKGGLVPREQGAGARRRKERPSGVAALLAPGA